LAHRANFWSCGATSAAVVVGGFCHYCKRRHIRTFLHWISDFHRRGHMGQSGSGRLGLGHYQFRFLDRYRTRRHAHLSHSVLAPAKMAHVHQSFCGGDDAFCCYLRGALMWDVFAVSTYFTVSVLFWYTGLIPDLATLRDRATTKVRKFLFGIFACGWRGSNRNWRHYEMAYLLLAGLSTPLVLSVHSVVSFDFATSVIPTWHSTIFPPYFVAGAIFGGFAMVLTLLLPARAIFKLHDVITAQHVDKMAKIILLTGSFVGYAYMMEFFVAWYSGNSYERYAFWNRIFGPYWWYWWVGMLFCNMLSPQLFWFKWCRRTVFVVFFVAT